MRNLCICKILFYFKSYPLRDRNCCVVAAAATLVAKGPPGDVGRTCRNLFARHCCQLWWQLRSSSRLFANLPNYHEISILQFKLQFSNFRQFLKVCIETQKMKDLSPELVCVRMCVGVCVAVCVCVSDRFYGYTFPCVFSRQIDPPTGTAGRQLSCSSSHSLFFSLSLAHSRSLSHSLPFSLPTSSALSLSHSLMVRSSVNPHKSPTKLIAHRHGHTWSCCRSEGCSAGPDFQ